MYSAADKRNTYQLIFLIQFYIRGKSTVPSMGAYIPLSLSIYIYISMYKEVYVFVYIYIHTHTHIFTLTGGQGPKSSKTISGATVVTEIRDRKFAAFMFQAEFETLIPLSVSVFDRSFTNYIAYRYITN
jgi:hypothetical protein